MAVGFLYSEKPRIKSPLYWSVQVHIQAMGGMIITRQI